MPLVAPEMKKLRTALGEPMQKAQNILNCVFYKLFLRLLCVGLNILLNKSGLRFLATRQSCPVNEVKVGHRFLHRISHAKFLFIE